MQVMVFAPAGFSLFVLAVQVALGEAALRTKHAIHGRGDHVLAEAETAIAAGTARKATGGKALAEVPKCSCDCCNVAERRAVEEPPDYSDVHIKCVPSDEHGPEVCGSQCAAADNDALLGATAEGAVLDMLRFCFFECKPGEGVASPLSTQCLALEDSEVQRVMDKSGNAVDPAVIYGRSSEWYPPASALLLSKARGGVHRVPAVVPSMAAPAISSASYMAVAETKNQSALHG